MTEYPSIERTLHRKKIAPWGCKRGHEKTLKRQRTASLKREIRAASSLRSSDVRAETNPTGAR